MVQKETKHILKGLNSITICAKGLSSHPKTAKWIEDTISKGMNQPIVPPIDRNWFNYDMETRKPKGTHRYGFL